ncbi:uncharacterized protein LOC113472379 [Diaphorina citri]|uniref:Uncharacterized protein LOC113472379 n=1 Tax=Diaphorina citri TaxID=121845 RepID=A0A3Q0JHN7_DIACI|nr:uncharacterized protein LOC113472379 [Diaphorina citri]
MFAEHVRGDGGVRARPIAAMRTLIRLGERMHAGVRLQLRLIHKRLRATFAAELLLGANVSLNDVIDKEILVARRVFAAIARHAIVDAGRATLAIFAMVENEVDVFHGQTGPAVGASFVLLFYDTDGF